MQTVTVKHNGKQTKVDNVSRAAVSCATASSPSRAVIDYIENGRECKMTVTGDVSIRYHS